MGAVLTQNHSKWKKSGGEVGGNSRSETNGGEAASRPCRDAADDSDTSLCRIACRSQADGWLHRSRESLPPDDHRSHEQHAPDVPLSSVELPRPREFVDVSQAAQAPLGRAWRLAWGSGTVLR